MTIDERLTPGLVVGRRIGIAGVAALIGGVLVLGVGGRLAMRLSGAMAIINDPRTRSMLTGDGFRIGTITLDGSLGLVIFGGVFGSIIAGGYWALLKPHLPARRVLLFAGLAAAAIGGNAFVQADNVDFVILHPIAMNVVLYPTLSALAGVTIVAIDRRLERRPNPPTVAGSRVLAVFGLIGAVLVLALMRASVGDEPWLAAELLTLAVFTVPLWLDEVSRWRSPAWMARWAPLVAGGVIAVEWVRLIRTGWAILG